MNILRRSEECFGRSDKPDAPADYSYARHVQWMSDWFTTLGLDAVTLVCQDWGGLSGLRLVAAFPDRFAQPAQRAAWEVLRRFDRPFLTAFGDSDPATAGQHLRFQQEVPGAKGQDHVTIAPAGHFLQEDQPAAFANAVIAFLRANPISR